MALGFFYIIFLKFSEYIINLKLPEKNPKEPLNNLTEEEEIYSMWPHQEEGEKKSTGPPSTVHLQDPEVKVKFQVGLPNSPSQGVAPHSTESSRR